MKTQMITKSKRLLITGILLFGFALQPYAQFSKMLEKAAEAAEAAGSSESSVEAEGDEGLVYVYASADRETKITDITGLTRIYCRAFIHKKQAKRASNRGSAEYGLWTGACSLGSLAEGKEYSSDGSEKVIGRNEMNGQSKALVEFLDFEIDLVQSTEGDITDNTIPEGDKFYIVLNDGASTQNPKVLSISAELTFDIKESAKSFASSSVDKNKDLKMKSKAMEDADLEAAVRKLFLKRGVSEIKRVHSTSGWTVETNGAGEPVRRWCHVNISCKEDGNCKFYWCRVWEEYQGGGKYQLPYDSNDSFNRIIRELVPCENL